MRNLVHVELLSASLYSLCIWVLYAVLILIHATCAYDGREGEGDS